jgi:putative restriction endonuclease
MRVFGEIEGIPVGVNFSDRRTLAGSGIHRPLQGGICGGADGAESIVISGGYADDQDNGWEVIYTGHGGRDPNSGRQVADQEWTAGNAGLRANCIEGRPVRLVRGAHRGSDFAPKSGFRYDGLFRIDSYWQEPGKDSFLICRFRLLADGGEEKASPKPAVVSQPVKRATSTIQRIVRNTEVTSRVKDYHLHACQFCGTKLQTPGGFYAEGAHIKALGQPHNGPDIEANVLCLCPNCHVLFDSGAVMINDDFTLIGLLGSLRLAREHFIDVAYVSHHRNHFKIRL